MKLKTNKDVQKFLSKYKLNFLSCNLLLPAYYSPPAGLIFLNIEEKSTCPITLFSLSITGKLLTPTLSMMFKASKRVKCFCNLYVFRYFFKSFLLETFSKVLFSMNPKNLLSLVKIIIFIFLFFIDERLK